MVSKTTLTVRYRETDQMGIVHHSVYPVWFECGRTDFIKNAGISYGQMEKDGIRLPLISLKCRYMFPSYYEDKITVKTSIKNLTPTRIAFFYEVFRDGNEKPVVSGETEHAWADNRLKPVNMKKYRPELYRFMEEMFVREESTGNE